MIKKLLSIGLTILFFGTILYASNVVNVKLKGIEITATSINGSTKNYLINHISYISEGGSASISRNWITDSVGMEATTTTNELGYIGAFPESITLKCENGFVTGVENNVKYSYKSLYLRFLPSDDNGKNFYLQVKCKKDIEEFKNNLVDNIELKEKDVAINSYLTNYAISAAITNVNESDAKDKFMEPNPDLQPKFVEIVYMQIVTMDNLINSLNNLNIDINTLFVNTSSRDYFDQWVSKFQKYNTTQGFVDAFESAITLKDIGMADNIVKTLSARLACEYTNPGSCTQKISITKTGQFEFYTLEEILDSIYVGGNSTSANIKSIYATLKDIKDDNVSSISNPAEKTYVISSYEDIFGHYDDASGFSLGEGNETRMSNIDKLTSAFNTANDDAKINIWGIYNFYYELANTSKGVNKTIVLEKGIENGTLQENIKQIAIKDISNKLSLLGDKYPFSVGEMGIDYKITQDLTEVLKLDNEIFGISLIGCNEGETIESFLNIGANSDTNNEIITEYDYWNMMEGLIKYAYTNVSHRTSTAADSLYDNGLFQINPDSNISMSLNDITEEAGRKNTFGYYFANDDKEPISGKVIFRNTDEKTTSNALSITSSEIPSNASYIGFWMGSDSYTLSSFIENGDIVNFKSTGGWPSASSYYGETNYGQKIKTTEGDDSIYFSYNESNINDRIQMQKDGSLYKWEDGVGTTFTDLQYNINVLIGDYYTVYLDMTQLQDTMYEKYFKLEPGCYVPEIDPDLILYYDIDSATDGTLIDDKSSSYNDGIVSGIITSTAQGLYFNGDSYIATQSDIPIGKEATIEIKANITSLEDQIIWEYGTNYDGIGLIIKGGKLILGGWTNDTCYIDTTDKLIGSWRQFGNTDISTGEHTLKVVIGSQGFYLYIDESLSIELDSNNSIDFGKRFYFDQFGLFKISIGGRNSATRYSTYTINNYTCTKAGDWWASNGNREEGKITDTNKFQGIIEYVKVWNVAKYDSTTPAEDNLALPEDTETTINTIVFPMRDKKSADPDIVDRNRFYVSYSKEQASETIDVDEAGFYDISVKVDREDYQIYENFDFFINGDIIKKSEDNGIDCHYEEDTSNLKLNGCLENIGSNIYLNKGGNSVTMRHPDFSLLKSMNLTTEQKETLGGSSHILSIEITPVNQ